MVLTLLVVAALAGLGIFTYNVLTRLRLLAANAWADIDVQLKRRHDLVPSLVAAVKGHAGYEKGTLESVVEARNKALAASGPRALGEAERDLAGSVRQILALAEAYPDLKAGESFLSLQRSLVEIEDHIQHARRYYNAVVRDLNTKVQQFPTSLVARAFGFHELEYFGIEDDRERLHPGVNLEEGK